MFTMILLLYLQQHLEVTLEGSSLRGVYKTKQECESAALRLRGPVPRPPGVSAAWHDAVCLPINRDVRVNEMAPLDLRALLDGTPPPGCGGSGDWRRVSESCRPSTAPAP